MKKALAVLFVATLAFAGQSFAELKTVVTGPTPEATANLQKQSTILNEMKGIHTEWDALIKEDKDLTQRYENIKWGQEQFKKQVEQYNAAFSAHQQDAAAYAASAADHNRRCSGTFNDQGYVNRCNAELPTGAAWKARVNQNAAYLEQTRDKLQQIQAATSRSTQEVFARHKAISARQEELQARFNVLKAELANVQNAVNSCKSALGGTNLDRAHDVCGEMFDGNKTPSKHTPGPNG